MAITANDPTADFVSDKDKGILETKRKIVFEEGRDLNLRNVLEVDVSGQWTRIKTADGMFHLVNSAKVNYMSIA